MEIFSPLRTNMPLTVKTPPRADASGVEVRLHDRGTLPSALPRLEQYLVREGPLLELSHHPAWLRVFERSLRYTRLPPWFDPLRRCRAR